MLTVCAIVPSAAQSGGPDPAATAAAPVTGSNTGTTGTTGTSTADSTVTVRLITGDEVTIGGTAGGGHTASIRPGAGRRDIVFHTSEQNGDVTVLPSDADALVRSGRLDRRLFDVTALVQQRYDEAHSAALPLIVGQPAGVTPAAVSRLTALAAPGDPVRDLQSIGARAIRVPATELGDFWQRLAPAGAPSATARTATAVPRVWLDGRVAATATTGSGVDQIKAPDVWKSGDRGADVKVAVLDTGVDQTHPDLRGRVALTQDFTDSPSGTNDLFGHGTHVSSIIAGDGAASDGRWTGVAPAANLLVGKVLGDDGYGYDSGVIAGMQWAADQGAKVVNMSLGEDDQSDGTDPMSQALNEISRASGTLFVVASGNNGEAGPRTVGIPGDADEALTVGAVDSTDALASFSSRGPRFGDGAVKPDVTAPGVDIVAARAAGTTLGDPVDPYYTTLSGTSMATPHVAGAAALLAYKHPDWSGRQIKDALISTADTIAGQLETDQGGGRIDVAAAALGPVTATGSVLLGSVHPTDPAGTTTVRYTNTSSAAVTLEPSLVLKTAGGRSLAAGAVRLGRTSLVVPAGKTLDLPVAVDPAAAQTGAYYGYLIAASPDGSVRVHTTVALIVHGATHTLTVVPRAVDDGLAESSTYLTVWGATGAVPLSDNGNGSYSAVVEDGTYQVRASFSASNPGGDGTVERLVVLPQVNVTKDTTVTADAGRTTQVRIRTPQPAAEAGTPYYQTYRQIDGLATIESESFFLGTLDKLYVSPTARVTDGSFEFSARYQLAAPMLTASAPGTGLDLTAFYMPESRLFDTKETALTAVDAGSIEQPDLRHVRGKLAVVRNQTGVSEADLARAAAAAGARGLLLVSFSDDAWTQWRPSGAREALPAIRIGHSVGEALLARLARHTTTVRFTSIPRSPYLYDVMAAYPQQIPQQVVYTVSAQNSAVIRTTYADNGGEPWASEQRFAWRPYQSFAWENTRYVPTGTARTEYVTANGTDWGHLVNYTTQDENDQALTAGMNDGDRFYRPGPQPPESWYQGVVRPSIPVGTPTPSVRVGDTLDLRIPEFTDSEAGHAARATVGGGFGGLSTATTGPASGTPAPPEGDSAQAVLYRDGVRVAGADNAWTDLEVAPGAADYRLDLTTSRVSPEWEFATTTATSWSFRSDTTADAALLPLLQLDYAVPVDASQAVRAARSHTIGVTVRAQDGAMAPRGVRVEVQTSWDDGKTWSDAKISGGSHNVFDAAVTRSARVKGDAYVTLRVTARDAAGDAVRQTVQRAYVWRG
ncbi:PA domain-containing protein [Streptomyces sp. DvalAA-14]|nr:PA domain-containing protein [Streptomyces sp. DvalAA-14]